MENREGPSERDNGQVTEVANVVRIPRDWFGPRDGLVPFGPQVADGEARGREPTSATRGETVDPNSFWGEGSGAIQDVVEAAPRHDARKPVAAMPAAGNVGWGRRPAELREWLRQPRFVAGMVAAAALAFACVGAMGLFAGHQASRGVGGSAGRPGEYASVANTHSIDARMIERPRVGRLVSSSHPARTTHVIHHSVSPAVVSNSARGEPVSYDKAPVVNQASTSSGEPAPYQAPPAAPSPPQRSSTTAASASDRSGSSASQPARPGPTGALTCLSNCG